MTGINGLHTGAQPHGYGRYTNGCRCAVCKKAKRDYMNTRRRRAAEASADRSGEGFAHGTRYGYEERGCRCPECAGFKREYSRQETHVRARRNHPAWRCDVCGYTYARCACPAPLAGKAAS